MSIEVGSIVEGTVTGITNFGAFVELPEGKVGLVHISEVADVYVKDVHEFLQEKQKVKVKVLNVDEHGKIGLSIKRLEENKSEENAETRPRRAQSFHSGPRHGGFANNDFKKPGRSSSLSFEDKLSRFLKESDERLTDLRRKTDSKRGGRGGGSRRYE